MLRRFFIPVLLVLVTIAAALYWLFSDRHGTRDVREAVPVKHYTLKNGMQLLVMPNDRLPAVTHLLMVRAGGADDPYGKTGLAHYLEHLLFSGTKRYPEGAYDRAIAKVGGEQNAYTNRDFTAYYATVPKDQLEPVMAMEADRLQHVQIDDAHAARELKVITEERNMRVENHASALFAEQIDAITFLNHPYGQPLIGWAEDMQRFTGDDARAFFARHYRASNLVLLVAGDVDVDEVRRLAQRYYGVLPAGAAPKRDWPQEPPARLARHATMRDAKLHEPRLLRQYVAPSVRSGERAQAMPLALYAHYLGGDATSLLYRRLVVEQKLASAVDTDYDPLNIGPSLLRIWLVPAAGVTLEQLEAALDAALEEALRQGVGAEELARVKTQLTAELVYAQDGMEKLAHLMGQLVMIGEDEHYFYQWAERVQAVSAEQMLEAAQAVFEPRRAVTGYLLPEAPRQAEAAGHDAVSPLPSMQSEGEMPAEGGMR